MKCYTYLLINFLTVIICFIASFHPKIQFQKYFIAFLKASMLVGVPFIIWDILFTQSGVWWFDYSYTLGYKISILPLEEWLFFICIPFSCTFTYFCINKFYNLDWTKKFNAILVWITILVCSIVALLFTDRIYTFVTASFTLLVIAYMHYISRADWIAKASFTYVILMLGFLPVNGVLTGTGIASPIVNYNTQEILNVRILTIPIEDAVYGYTQFILNIHFFLFFSKKTKSTEPTIL